MTETDINLGGRLVVTGAGGMLGSAVVRHCLREGLEHVGFTHDQLQITDDEEILEHIRDTDIVINCAGITPQAAEAGRVPPAALCAVNSLAPHALAERAHRVLQVSTDCVFDGCASVYDGRTYAVPKAEWTVPAPVDDYGRSKLAGELRYGNHLTVRTSFIGFHDSGRGLLEWLVAQPEGATVPGWEGAHWSGLYVDHAAAGIVLLAREWFGKGPVHLCGPTWTKADLLEQIAARIRPDLKVERIPRGVDRSLTSAIMMVHYYTVPTRDQLLEAVERGYHDSYPNRTL